MHYLGDAGISNFKAVYSLPYVAGAAISAIAATNTALSLFFLMKKNFTNSWWKRIVIGNILASGVSSMHWIGR